MYIMVFIYALTINVEIMKFMSICGFGEVVMRIQGAEGLILLRELMIV